MGVALNRVLCSWRGCLSFFLCIKTASRVFYLRKSYADATTGMNCILGDEYVRFLTCVRYRRLNKILGWVWERHCRSAHLTAFDFIFINSASRLYPSSPTSRNMYLVIHLSPIDPRFSTLESSGPHDPHLIICPLSVLSSWENVIVDIRDCSS